MNDADKKETADNQLPPPPAEIPAEATEAARKIDAMREKLQSALAGDGLLRADIVSADGKRSRSVVLIRPDAKMRHPSVTQATYEALCRMLGDKIATTAPFDIAVVALRPEVNLDSRSKSEV